MEKKTVLVVDDAMFMRAVIKNILKNIEMCNVIGEADNGVDAVKKAEEFQPDFITLDVVMPDQDGLASIKGILNASPKTKIIMVTSVSDSKTITKAIEEGAFDYVVKPVSKEDLEKIINRATNS